MVLLDTDNLKYVERFKKILFHEKVFSLTCISIVQITFRNPMMALEFMMFATFLEATASLHCTETTKICGEN